MVLEGPDGAGKSTLLEELSHFLGRKKTHTGGPCYNKEDLVRRMEEIEQHNNGLFDRVCHISNPIYCQAENRDAFFTVQEYWEQLALFDPVVVYVNLNDPRKLRKNISREPKPHKPPEYTDWVVANSGRISTYYEIYMRSVRDLTNVRMLHYDYEHTGRKRFLSNLTAMINED